MKRRHRMSKGHSRRTFTKHASKMHRRNAAPSSSSVMRGGIRL